MNSSSTVVFALPGNERLAEQLCLKMGYIPGGFSLRNFPDGETYVRVNTDVQNKAVILVCTLNNPDSKLPGIYFLAKTLRELGAQSICLVAPYLAYMRQDKRFLPGEGITSAYFATFLSTFIDRLITVDPHLHRRNSLSEIYTVPAYSLHAGGEISKWISNHVSMPLLIGPDSESKQWVAEVARNSNAPYTILQKVRKGDKAVEVSIPEVEKYKNHTPVLVDDIISTARTMIETVAHLNRAGMKPAICIGIHAVFAGKAFDELRQAGIERVVTCNTIPHESNGIDIDDLIVACLQEYGPG